RTSTRSRSWTGSTWSRTPSTATRSSSGASATPTAGCGRTTCSPSRAASSPSRRRGSAMADAEYSILLAGGGAPAAAVDAIQGVEGDSALDVASMFRIRMGIVQPGGASSDWSVLAHEVFKPLQPLTVRVELDGAAAVTLLNGYVSGLVASFAD